MITYLQYTAGSNKGATKAGDVFNSVFGLGTVDPDYTSARVVETITLEEVDGAVVGKLSWRPVLTPHNIQGGMRDDADSIYWGREAIKTALRLPAFVTPTDVDASDNKSLYGDTLQNAKQGYGSITEAAEATTFQNEIKPDLFKVTSASGIEDLTPFTVVNALTGMISIEGGTAGQTVKVAYLYDNQVIPQQDLPLLNASMQSIPLVAHARRIAIDLNVA